MPWSLPASDIRGATVKAQERRGYDGAMGLASSLPVRELGAVAWAGHAAFRGRGDILRCPLASSSTPLGLMFSAREKGDASRRFAFVWIDVIFAPPTHFLGMDVREALARDQCGGRGVGGGSGWESCLLVIVLSHSSFLSPPPPSALVISLVGVGRGNLGHYGLKAPRFVRRCTS